VKAAVNVPVVANGDLASFEGAQAMFSASAADAVMVGRAARGRPWFPGQLARYLETGIRAPDPVPTEQRDILLALYDAWLVHYGRKRGVREARKHLGWALEAAACSCGRSTEWLKFWRGRLVTEEEPTRVARNIRDAFDDLAWGVAA
jgi:tRNA-dihydrouridine synthase